MSIERQRSSIPVESERHIKDIHVVILHGNFEMKLPAWEGQLKLLLSQLGFARVTGELLPDSLLARKKHWLSYLHDLHLDQNAILIGFSSGAVAALEYARHHQLLGLVLINPCFSTQHLPISIPEKMSGYYTRMLLGKQIMPELPKKQARKNSQFVLMYASENDDVVDTREPRFLARLLHTPLQSFPGGHHAVVNQQLSVVVHDLQTELMKLGVKNN